MISSGHNNNVSFYSIQVGAVWAKDNDWFFRLEGAQVPLVAHQDCAVRLDIHPRLAADLDDLDAAQHKDTLPRNDLIVRRHAGPKMLAHHGDGVDVPYSQEPPHVGGHDIFPAGHCGMVVLTRKETTKKSAS
jgi:hypothetical protein